MPTTAFTAIAGGGAAVNPLTSFNYRPVGVILEMTPRVTYEDEIILDLMVENSTLGPSIEVAGTSLPTFGSRRVVTRLRLRDGESNLLAGLFREQERKTLRGFPGLLRIPILRSLFSSTDEQISQTDIIMLLTPRIVRTHSLTQEDLNPIHIGTQQNIGLSGPPALIAAPPLEPAAGGRTRRPSRPACCSARSLCRPRRRRRRRSRGWRRQWSCPRPRSIPCPQRRSIRPHHRPTAWRRTRVRGRGCS